jgi:hypothetical protein
MIVSDAQLTAVHVPSADALMVLVAPAGPAGAKAASAAARPAALMVLDSIAVALDENVEWGTDRMSSSMMIHASPA